MEHPRQREPIPRARNEHETGAERESGRERANATQHNTAPTHRQSVAVRIVHLAEPLRQRVEDRVLEVRVEELGVAKGGGSGVSRSH
jgi:hypothetical protein